MPWAAAGDASTILYEAIPPLPSPPWRGLRIGGMSTLQTGILDDRPVMVMQGRFTYTRIHAWASHLSHPGHCGPLGVRSLILSNAAGGMNTAFHEGDLMVIRDHINLTGENPLIGAQRRRLGPPVSPI